MLTASELDLAITVAWGTTLQMAVAKGRELAHEPLANMTASVFAPSQHPLANRNKIALEELALQRWAVPHGLSMSYIFEDAFVSKQLAVPAFLKGRSLLTTGGERSRNVYNILQRGYFALEAFIHNNNAHSLMSRQICGQSPSIPGGAAALDASW